MMAGHLRTSDLEHFPPASIPASQVGSAEEASFRWAKGPEGVSHRAAGCTLEAPPPSEEKQLHLLRKELLFLFLT